MLVSYDLVSGELRLEFPDGRPAVATASACLQLALYGDAIARIDAIAGQPSVTLTLIGEDARNET